MFEGEGMFLGSSAMETQLRFPSAPFKGFELQQTILIKVLWTGGRKIRLTKMNITCMKQ